MNQLTAIPQSLGVFIDTFKSLQKSKEPDSDLNRLKKEWAEAILGRLSIELTVKGKPHEEGPLLLVGNHISYVDIPLLISVSETVSFVAKSELKSWPVFGTAARQADTVFVKRESSESRHSARESIREALTENKRMVIFPSGTTSIDERKTWKKGTFEIAHENDVLIQPFRISYKPLRAVAYIDRDFFPVHLNQLFGVGKIEAEIEFHPPVKVKDPIMDCLYWQYWSRAAVETLTSFSPISDNYQFQNA